MPDEIPIRPARTNLSDLTVHIRQELGQEEPGEIFEFIDHLEIEQGTERHKTIRYTHTNVFSNTIVATVEAPAESHN